jgi:hypothetical protein
MGLLDKLKFVVQWFWKIDRQSAIEFCGSNQNKKAAYRRNWSVGELIYVNMKVYLVEKHFKTGYFCTDSSGKK